MILKKGAVAGKRKATFPLPISFRFSFVFALSQFRRPDYLGAWNRLKLPTLPINQDLISQDRNENDSGPRFKNFFKYKRKKSHLKVKP